MDSTERRINTITDWTLSAQGFQKSTGHLAFFPGMPFANVSSLEDVLGNDRSSQSAVYCKERSECLSWAPSLDPNPCSTISSSSFSFSVGDGGAKTATLHHRAAEKVKQIPRAKGQLRHWPVLTGNKRLVALPWLLFHFRQ